MVLWFFLSNQNFCYRFLSFYKSLGVQTLYTIGSKLGYDKLGYYCVIENHAYIAFHFLVFNLFSFQQKKSVTDFSAPILARLFKFCIHLECGQVCVKDDQKAYFNFCLLFSFPSFLCCAYDDFHQPYLRNYFTYGVEVLYYCLS